MLKDIQKYVINFIVRIPVIRLGIKEICLPLLTGRYSEYNGEMLQF